MGDLSDALSKVNAEKDTTINIIEIIAELEEEDKVIEGELLRF